MGGGCQGCAVSAMTLRDGIERAIKENVPEITEVVDATDHDAGENPFYTVGSAPPDRSAAAGEQADAEQRGGHPDHLDAAQPLVVEPPREHAR